jgi:integrase
MQGRITNSAVARLLPGETLHDTSLLGFIVRRQVDATVYSVRGRVKGQKVRLTLGRHGTLTPHNARKEAGRILALMRSGQDPRADKTSAMSFRDAAERFLEHVKAKRSVGTAREYEGHFNDHLVPRFGRRALDAVTTEQLATLHLHLKERPVLANRILATASSLYGWAGSQGLCADLFNPARRVERYKEEGKERFLSAEELKRLGKALRAVEAEGRWNPFAIAAIRLLLLTGCRRNEIRLAQWPDVDWERALLNLRNAKGGKRSVHLNAGAMLVLEGLCALPDNGNPYIIRGVADDEPYKNLQDVWDVVRTRAQLDDVRLHDLRHSVASFAGADGASLPLIGAVLGHQSVAASKRYTHLAGDPAKAVAERIGERIIRGLGE